MNVVIVTPELPGPAPCGTIGTFAFNWAQLLQNNGENVTLFYTGPMQRPLSNWETTYKRAGLKVQHIPMLELTVEGWNYEWFIRQSEAVHDAIPDDTDVVYFQDWQANGFHPVRKGRFTAKKRPVYVTILHQPWEWQRDSMHLFPKAGYYDLSITYAEEYTVQYSDFVISPTQYMFDWVADYGWQLPDESKRRVMPYPLCVNYKKHEPNPARYFRRIIYRGDFETRFGINLFVDALEMVKKDTHHLDGIEEIVLLGNPPAPNPVEDYAATGPLRSGPERLEKYADFDMVVQHLERIAPKANIVVLNDNDHNRTLQYLSNRANDSLVVIPPRAENLSMSTLALLSVEGLSVLLSRAGGIPEVVTGHNTYQLFGPHKLALKRSLEMALAHGPYDASDMQQYDVDAANANWLSFHRSLAKIDTTPPQVEVNGDGRDSSEKMLDICVPYYNYPDFLPHLLQSLEHQTRKDFNVYVVNDGSPDPRAVEVFKAMRDKYQDWGWQFYSKPNEGIGTTRNFAASLGSAPYITFMDADNAAAVNMVEEFIGGMERSGDDALTCHIYAFFGDQNPYVSYGDEHTPPQLLPAEYVIKYLGNCTAAGIFLNPFGDANSIIRRSVFEEVGGFSTYRYLSYEDAEFFAKLSLGGYKLDVIPEYLFYYRVTPGGFSRVTSKFRNEMRVLRRYQEVLNEVGMSELPPTLYGLYQQTMKINEEAPDDFSQVNADTGDPEWVADNLRWSSVLRGMQQKVNKRLNEK